MQLWLQAWNLCVIQMRMQISDGEQKFTEKTLGASFLSEVLNLESNVDIWNTNTVNYIIFRWEKLIWKDIPGGWQIIRPWGCYVSLRTQLPAPEVEEM